MIGIVYFAVIIFGALPDHFILFPSSNRIDPHGATRKTIPFENGELELWTAKSKLVQPNGYPDTYVLRFYGNADRAERWVAAEADAWNKRTIEIWGMNYPGFGGSTGPAKLRRIGPAAVTAFDALQREAKDNRSSFLLRASAPLRLCTSQQTEKLRVSSYIIHRQSGRWSCSVSVGGTSGCWLVQLRRRFREILTA
ncbi:MAG: hypothetical protein DME57_09370 [Verrucomicrobia bacterium]|nr:MAG: hypothetical protein DME57_09370 [Verrucomicrobiota bacterium]